MLYSQLVFVALACVVVTLLKVMRDPGRYGRAYGVILLVAGLALIKGAVDEPRSYGLFGVGLTVIAVVLPALLDLLASALWSRSRLHAASVLAELRGHLLTGGLSALHAQIWRALSKVPSEGPLAAAAELSELEQVWSGPVAQDLLFEQIFSVYASDGQWTRAVEFLTAQGKPKPELGPGAHLELRAYMETGRFEQAKSRLDTFMSPVSASPWLLQAQWVFLAMTGDPDIPNMASQTRVQVALGLCPAKALLWTAIAYRAQGQANAAHKALEKLRVHESKLHVLERRGVEVVRESLARPVQLDLDPEVRRFAQEVKASLRAYLRRGPRMLEPRGQVWVLLLFLGSLARLLAQVDAGFGMDAMLEWGWLTPAIWSNGGFWTVLTAPWLRHDFFDCLLVGYLWWISSLHAPARFGALRWILALVLTPSLSLLGMALAAPNYAGAGASTLALVSAMCSVLWSIPKHAGQSGRLRGGGVILAMLLAVKLVAALLDPAGGPYAAMTMALCALMVFALFRVAAPAITERPSTKGEGLALFLVLSWVLAWPLVRLGPPVATLVQRDPMHCSAEGINWQLSSRWSWPSSAFAQAMPFPKLQGWIDRGAWQGRQWVQLGLLDRSPGLADDALTSLSAWPSLQAGYSVARPAFTLPSQLLELAQQDPSVRVVQLRQDGEAVALLAERDLSAPDGTRKTVLLLWQPSTLVNAYLPSQIEAFAHASWAPESTLPPCPGTAFDSPGAKSDSAGPGSAKATAKGEGAAASSP